MQQVLEELLCTCVDGRECWCSGQVRTAFKRATEYGYVGSNFTAAEWFFLVALYGGRCLRCTSLEKLSVDHVISLSRGGSNTIENIQPLCRACNILKDVRIRDYRPGAMP